VKIGFASTDWSHTVKDDRGHPVWGGAGWARLGQYEDLLPFDVVVGPLAFHKGIFGVSDWDKQNHFNCDIIYMQRVMFEDVPERIMEARANGQIIINDLDDWYWGLSPSNGAWAASHPKNNPSENINHYKRCLAASTVVTVSTPYLAERISKWVSRPIVLIPNFVDTNKFSLREQSDAESPIVGWVGSTGHRSGDLETMRGILGPMADAGKIRLHHSGHIQGRKSFAEGIGVDVEKVSTLPMAAPSDYQNLFQFDVGLVPLSSAPFNNAKSAIKGLEYSSAGIPFIAANSQAYVSLAEEGVGLVASKPKEWIANINKLRDPDLRIELGREYRRIVQEKYDVSMGAALLTRFFGQVHSAL
jgi:glycosyltransferase involved in cell wall biosynthesis